MLAQPGLDRLTPNVMNQPGALCQDCILIEKRENSTSVRGENVEVTVSHLPYHFTYGLFSSRQDCWKDHILYITKMEEYQKNSHESMSAYSREEINFPE